MLGVLIGVTHGAGPEINTGPVGLLCTIVVCGITKHDMPIVPVTWDKDECKCYAGFQVNLVGQPSIIRAKIPNGSYLISHQWRGHFQSREYCGGAS